MRETHPCRFPFQDCRGCERCAVPVVTIPPEAELLRTKMAGLTAAFVAFAVLAVVAFSWPAIVERVNSANQESMP